MSDHIPLDIQSEIIKRLPVKYVIQCRSVSKSFKSLIDSPKFIANYHHQQQQQHHLFVKYNTANSFCSDDQEYFSIVDDDTFPNQKTSLTVPQSVKVALHYKTILTSVNGLLCYHLDPVRGAEHSLAVLWNPTIQKSVAIRISNSLIPPTGLTHICFGVCPNTSDPKLVRINTCYLKVNNPRDEDVDIVNNWEVEVFMLSTRVWKSVSNIPSAFKTCNLSPSDVCIDGFIYMVAYDTLAEDHRNSIVSFDLKSDEFGEVCLPDRLVHAVTLEVSNVYRSLGLFHHYYSEGGKTGLCDVWVMKEGVSKSFTKMLSIQLPDTWWRCSVLELRKNGGEAIIQHTDSKKWSVLEVYDTSTGSISCMGINRSPFFFLVNSYMETLLLLDVKSEDDDKV